jgi:hypothetical protein
MAAPARIDGDPHPRYPRDLPAGCIQMSAWSAPSTTASWAPGMPS